MRKTRKLWWKVSHHQLTVARLVTYLLLYIFQHRGYFNQISYQEYSKYGSERLYDGYSN
jgi:hypothetical protein